MPSGPERRTYGHAITTLAAAQKSSVGAPAYSRFVNRPLGRRFAATGYVIGLSPNQITLISATFTLSGVAVIALAEPSLVTAVVVTALLVLGYGLDAADGQLARLTGKGSFAGEWLDHMADSIKASALHLAVAISFVRFFEVPLRWALVPLGFTLVSAVFFFGVILTEQLRKAAHGGTAPKPVAGTTRSSPIYALAVIPVDYGFLCLTFITLAWPDVFRGVYTVMFVCNALILAASLLRWFRAVDRLPK